MTKKNKSKKFAVAALATFAVATALAVLGMSATMGEIKGATISSSPTAILASAGLSEEKGVILPVAYYDQRMDECVNTYDASAREAVRGRQFEWASCGYYNKDLEKGLVEYKLSEDYLPVAVGGKLMSNRGLVDMGRWFDAVEGKSASYIGNLKMEYHADKAEFSFYKEEFYPLDGAEFSAEDSVNEDGHNHLFTMNFAVPFTTLASGDENFEILADDDTFVYIGDKLVIDMGGIHDAVTGRFVINKDGEVYSAVGDEDFAYSGVTVEAGSGQLVRIFHADRNASESVFGIQFAEMNLSVTSTEFADNKSGDGVQIAYDPTDPTYVAPLGESSVVRPDATKGFIVMVTMEGVMVVVFAVLMAAAIRSVVRRKA